MKNVRVGTRDAHAEGDAARTARTMSKVSSACSEWDERS